MKKKICVKNHGCFANSSGVLLRHFKQNAFWKALVYIFHISFLLLKTFIHFEISSSKENKWKMIALLNMNDSLMLSIGFGLLGVSIQGIFEECFMSLPPALPLLKFFYCWFWASATFILASQGSCERSISCSVQLSRSGVSDPLWPHGL